MTKFLKHIGIFIIVVIALFIGIYLLFSYNHVFSHAADYNSKDFDQAFKQRDYDLIAIGNSKVMVSIDKAVLEKELNVKAAILAYGSTDISISKLTLEAYLNKAIKKPKLVLLEVSWFTFNTNRTHFSNLSGDLFLEDYRLIDHIFKYQPQSAHNLRDILFNKFKGFFPTSDKITKRKKKKATKKKKKEPKTKNYRFNIDRFEKIFPNHKAGIDPLLFDDYKAIIALCKENNISLLLYTAPEDQEYALVQKDRKLIKDIFKNSYKNNSNIRYLDYSYGGDLYKIDYENWLADSHHLKEKTLFTKIFVKDIKDRLSDDLLLIE